MTFSQFKQRRWRGVVAATVACCTLAVPTAASAFFAAGEEDGVTPSYQLHVYGVGATEADATPVLEWHTPGLGGALVDPPDLAPANPLDVARNLPDDRAVHGPVAVPSGSVNLPDIGPAAAPSGSISRPAPAYGIAAQAPQFPTIEELEQFRFVPGQLSATQVEADNWKAVLNPGGLPQYSVDGPRTAPDALVRPTVQAPVAEPGFDWSDAGIGIAIGTLAGIMLGAALLMGRRRRTLAGA
jgi:hypothetical protein